MKCKIFRVNPHAALQREGEVLHLRFCGIGLDGRRRDALLPAGDIRWLATGFVFEKPIPFGVLHTPRDLARRKIFALDFDTDDGLTIGLLSHRIESVHLPHNAPIADIYFLSLTPIEFQLLEGSPSETQTPHGNIRQSPNPA